jgi:hypothetical protein
VSPTTPQGIFVRENKEQRGKERRGGGSAPGNSGLELMTHTRFVANKRLLICKRKSNETNTITLHMKSAKSAK